MFRNARQIKRVIIIVIIMFLAFNVNVNVTASRVYGPYFTDAFYGASLKITIRTASSYISGHEQTFIILMSPIFLNESIFNISVMSIIPYVVYSDLSHSKILEQKLVSNTEYLTHEILLPLNESEVKPLVIRVQIPNFVSYKIVKLSLKIALKVVTNDFEAAGFIDVDNVGLLNIMPEPILLRDKGLIQTLMVALFLSSLVGISFFIRRKTNFAMVRGLILILVVILINLIVPSFLIASVQYPSTDNVMNIPYEKLTFNVSIANLVRTTTTIMIPSETPAPDWFLVNISSSILMSNGNITACQFLYVFEIYETNTNRLLSNESVTYFVMSDIAHLSHVFYDLAVGKFALSLTIPLAIVRAWFSNGSFVQVYVTLNPNNTTYFITISDHSGSIQNAFYAAILLFTIIGGSTIIFIFEQIRFLKNLKK